MGRALIVGIAVTAVGCRQRSAAIEHDLEAIPVAAEISDVGRSDGGAVDAPAPSPIELALRDDKPPYGNDVRRAVCGTRTDCRVIRVTPAGAFPDGRTRELVTVAPFAANASETAPPERNYDDAAVEQWMLFRAAGVLTGRQFVASDMDYGYSLVEDKPLDGVVLSAGKLTYTDRWRGLSRFTGTWSNDIDLDRMQTVRSHGVNFDKLTGESHGSYDHNWDSLRLRNEHYEPDCSKPTLFDDKTGDIVRVMPRAFTVEWDAIPILSGVRDLADTESIDACAPLFDGASAGFAKGTVAAADASFRAVLVDDTLVVDVVDDVIGAADVLEVWTAPDAAHGLLRCEPPYEPRKPIAGTQIELGTGATKALEGAPPTGVRVTRGPAYARVRFPLAVVHDTYGDSWPALAVLLRDSDDGTKTEREIATTKAFRRRLVDLGDYAPHVRCVRSPTGLVRDRSTESLRPLIGG